MRNSLSYQTSQLFQIRVTLCFLWQILQGFAEELQKKQNEPNYIIKINKNIISLIQFVAEDFGLPFNTIVQQIIYIHNSSINIASYAKEYDYKNTKNVYLIPPITCCGFNKCGSSLNIRSVYKINKAAHTLLGLKDVVNIGCVCSKKKCGVTYYYNYYKLDAFRRYYANSIKGSLRVAKFAKHTNTRNV